MLLIKHVLFFLFLKAKDQAMTDNTKLFTIAYDMLSKNGVKELAAINHPTIILIFFFLSIAPHISLQLSSIL